MAWNSFATPLIGKAVRAASRLAHGGGSAFPGKIVERIDPQFLSRTLAQLPLGVVLVSGTAKPPPHAWWPACCNRSD